MDTKKDSAVSRKLQRRKFALKAFVATTCVTAIVGSAKMEAFAAFTKKSGSDFECIVSKKFWECLYFVKDNPPTEEMTYADRKTAYEYSDEELLAICNVVQAEANAESMRGKTAVAAVVLNRFFGDNAFTPGEKITSLIVPGQFAFTKHSMEWFEEHNPSVIKAVEYACKGYDPTAEFFKGEGALYYYAEWDIGEWGETTIINEGKRNEAIVIDRQAYHQ